jgi:F0F1-type ATP synthase assembly protein I
MLLVWRSMRSKSFWIPTPIAPPPARSPSRVAARYLLDLQALPHDPCESDHSDSRRHDVASISVLVGILVVVVVGAICFWAIDKFANDRRLANLLKLLVVLVCLGAIVQRLLVLMY